MSVPYAGGYLGLSNSFTSLNRGVQLFGSLYESFQALTSIQVSHFVEWFSGDDISTIWTKRDIAGTNTFAMDDSIDGGFSITTGTTNNDIGQIDFNAMRHYDLADFVLLVIANATSATSRVLKWEIGDASGTQEDPSNAVRFNDDTRGSFIAFTTRASATQTATDTDISSGGTTAAIYKIEANGTNAKGTIDGVLKVTNTTNLPTGKGQPSLKGRTLTTAAKTFQFRYLECYNESISILSSLYERLSALTQVLRQRVVEHFSGDVVPERWTFTDQNGSNTTTMRNGIDGGYTISTGATTGNWGNIHFNDKRQYDWADSVFIFTAKRRDANCRVRVGGVTANGFTNHFVSLEESTANTFKELETRDGATTSSTASSVAIDTAMTNYKIENGSADNLLYINGVLEVTKTTNRPASRLQPTFAVETLTTAGVAGDIIYMEAYNKLTTETDYPSVYEFFSELTTVLGQRFWDWFDGSVLSTRWIQQSIAGSPTFTISDEIDGGFSIQTGTSSLARGEINFNGKKVFDNQASELIAVAKAEGTLTETEVNVGYGENGNFVDSFSLARWTDAGTVADYKLQTDDGTTSSSTLTDVPPDINWHVHKIVLGASNNLYYIDGVLKVTKTTNLPDQPQQPMFHVRSQGTTNREGRLRYIEVKNT